MKKLVICGDDFGMSLGINKAIVDLFIHNRISLTTIMANSHYFDDAVCLSKQYQIPCGIHLTISTEQDKMPLKPLLSSTPTDINGNFFPNVFPYFDKKDKEYVYEEFKAQICKVIDAGIVPTHIDSHMHIYSKDVLKQLSKEFNLPCRDFFEIYPKKYGTLFHLTNIASGIDEKINALLNFLNSTECDQNIIVCHPTLDLLEMKKFVSPQYRGRYNWQTKLRFEDYPCLLSNKLEETLKVWSPFISSNLEGIM